MKSPENCRFREHDWQLMFAWIEPEGNYLQNGSVLMGTNMIGSNTFYKNKSFHARWICKTCYAKITRELDELEYEDLQREGHAK